MTCYKKIAKVIDFSILFIVLLLLLGFISYDYKIFGFSKPILKLPENYIYFFEILPWILLPLLVVDLYVKFLVVRDVKKFVRKHWLDIALSLSIPILYPLKAITFAIKSVKYFKFGKYTYKLYDKFKKLNKKKI